MLRLQAGQRVQCLSPLVDGLVGQPVHQVQVHIVEPGLACGLECVDRFGRLMTAAQQVQQIIIQALHSNAQAVDALGQNTGTCRGVQVSGVGFDGDLRARIHLIRRLDTSKYLFYVAGRQVGWGAAAEED